MIADSPYQSGELVLHPIAGLVGGIIGAGWMIVFISLTGSLVHVNGLDVSNATGMVGWTSSAVIVGGLCIVLGGIFGLLYALCEQRGSRRELVFVGLFYGFLLWILGGVVASSFMSEVARLTLRSVSFLFACLIYGLWLALLAIWSEHVRPAVANSIPKD